MKEKEAIAFEDIRDIRRLYQRGNRQGRGYRGEMNRWPFAEIKRQIECKAARAGTPVIHLTEADPPGRHPYLLALLTE